MAVSSLSRDFRKIDIEQYADDFYVDDEPDNSLAGPDEMAVQSAINGGQQQVSICLVSFFYHFSRTLWSLHSKTALLHLAARH